jgi:hypothetical protein
MESMNITSAQYQVGIDGNNCAVRAVIDGATLSVPLDPANRHYAEILKLVAAGTLTIQDAE